MPLRGIIAGLGLAFVTLGWWHVLQRRARAAGTVTARPPRREHVGMASTEITFQVDGRPITFQPSAITSFDVGKLELGAKVAVAYDPNDPTSADLAAPWRRYSGPVLVTLIYLAALYYLFVA
jgi:hypothetical protein